MDVVGPLAIGAVFLFAGVKNFRQASPGSAQWFATVWPYGDRAAQAAIRALPAFYCGTGLVFLLAAVVIAVDDGAPTPTGAIFAWICFGCILSTLAIAVAIFGWNRPTIAVPKRHRSEAGYWATPDEALGDADSAEASATDPKD